MNALGARGELIGVALALWGAALLLVASAAAANADDSPGRVWTLAAASWATIGASWAATPAAALAAPLLPALEFAARRRISWAMHVPMIALLVMLTILGGVGQAVMDAPETGSSPARVVASVKAAFAPVNLLVHHAPGSSSDTLLWLGVLAVGLGTFALRPAIGAGLLWFALAIRFAPGRDDSFDESSMPIAIAGLVLSAAALLDVPRVRTWRVVMALPVALALVGCIALASTRNNVWRSEAALWLQASEACPECAAPLDRLGRLHFDQAMRESTGTGLSLASGTDTVTGHLEFAAELLDRADTIAGPEAERAAIRVNALRLLGRGDAAEAALRAARERYPDDVQLLLLAAQSPGARQPGPDRSGPRRTVRVLRLAGEREPLPDPATLQYARALAGIGNWSDAAVVMQRAGESTDPAIAALRTEIGARIQAAQSTLAIYYQAASRVTPADRATIQSSVLDAEGHYQLAAQVAWDAFARQPDVVGPWRAAGIAEQHLGRLAEFIAGGVPAPSQADPAAVWTEFAKFLAQLSEWTGVERVHSDALGLGEFDASMRTASVAREVGRAPVASAYLQRAAGLDAANPAPWVQLAEIAIDAQQQDAAREAIANAEQRGANTEVLNALKARAGIGTTDVPGLRRTIIR